jgi:hypothetical protein
MIRTPISAVHSGDLTLKTKCQSKMPIRSKTRRGELGPEWDFPLWFATQGSLEGILLVSPRIRERFANIQELQSTEIALLRFSSFTDSFSSASAPVQSSQGVRSLSYLKRGIERCHLGVTKRHRERVMEFGWHPIS